MSRSSAACRRRSACRVSRLTLGIPGPCLLAKRKTLGVCVTFHLRQKSHFCGHATIALGALLAKQMGKAVFKLQLNGTQITVEGISLGGQVSGAFQSPKTSIAEPSSALVAETLAFFDYESDQLDPRLPPMLINAGSDHMALTLNSRQALSGMTYDLSEGRALMLREGWITVILAFAETNQLFHTRNPFASGGVYEDPATGSASAAYAGYLRDMNWPHQFSSRFRRGGLARIAQYAPEPQHCAQLARRGMSYENYVPEWLGWQTARSVVAVHSNHSA